MKSAIICLAMIFLSFNLVFAQSEKDLATEYLELSKTKETFDSTIETCVNEEIKKNPSINKETIYSIFNESMGWDVSKMRYWL